MDLDGWQPGDLEEALRMVVCFILVVRWYQCTRRKPQPAVEVRRFLRSWIRPSTRDINLVRPREVAGVCAQDVLETGGPKQ